MKCIKLQSVIFLFLIFIVSGCSIRWWDSNQPYIFNISSTQDIIGQIRREGNLDFSLDHLNKLRGERWHPGRYTRFEIKRITDSTLRASIRVEYGEFEEAFRSMEWIHTDSAGVGASRWISGTFQGGRQFENSFKLRGERSYYRRNERKRLNYFQLVVKDSISNKRKFLKVSSQFQAFARNDSLYMFIPKLDSITQTKYYSSELWSLYRINMRDSTLILYPERGVIDFRGKRIKVNDIIWIIYKYRKFTVEGIRVNSKYLKDKS